MLSNSTNEFVFVQPKVLFAGYIKKELADPVWISPYHKHDCTEVIFCTKGSFNIIICGEEFTISQGDIVIYPCLAEHKEITNNDTLSECFFMGIDAFVFPSLPKNVLISNNTNYVQPSGPFKNQLQFYCTELLREASCNNDLCTPIITSLASLILIHILRIIDFYKKDLIRNPSYSLKIKEFIDANYKRNINLDSISESVFISKHYTCHIFKDDFGVSPIEYLIKKRISIAQHLLINTVMSISDIAYEVGYIDPLYFSQLFKHRVSLSPSAYRKQNTINS